MALTRRQMLGVLGALGGSAVLAGAAVTSSCAPASSLGAGATRIRHSYASGASCYGAANGQFADWRSQVLGIVATWSHNGDAETIAPGAEYGAWRKNIDYAPQFHFDGDFDWSSCADGEYDAELRRGFETVKSAWGNREGTLYYRFQHEPNGTWFPWSVLSVDGIPAYLAGWRRAATLFREIFPADDRFQFTWSLASGLPSSQFPDIRQLYPGGDYVDVISVDHYDFFGAGTRADWDRNFFLVDSGGGPAGLGAWLRFAKEEGKPLAVSEWGNQFGDNPTYIQGMLETFREYAYSGLGPSAGRLIYDIYFNQLIDDGGVWTEGDFRIQVDGKDHPDRPEAARAYRSFVGGWNIGDGGILSP